MDLLESMNLRNYDTLLIYCQDREEDLFNWLFSREVREFADQTETTVVSQKGAPQSHTRSSKYQLENYALPA